MTSQQPLSSAQTNAPPSGKRIPVAILGATGTVGQRFIRLLENHPWFEIAALTGSERTIGKPYGELVRWVLDGEPPPAVASMIVQPSDTPLDVAIALSALPTDAAREVEPRWAERVAVCSNASAYRMALDVPLLIPEVNPDQLGLIERQRAERGWRGCLLTNPNCATISAVMALKPLHDAFGIQKIHIATLQAISGAGYPGVASFDILDNIIPNIADGSEEAKIEAETRKLLGVLRDGQVAEPQITISAHVTRVPVMDGHTALMSIGFERKPTPAQAIVALENFAVPEAVRGLPSSPERAIIVRYESDRPQPRRDRDAGNGMSASVGRVRACPLLDLRLVALTHNTIRGAAGGALLNAELLVAMGVVS
jgi:aspartate-semialdehyde dehydrogenase